MKKPKILVIGDAMLDIANYGSVSRVSPEAPLPILDVHETKYFAGGAANVMRNLEAMGADTTFIFNVGEDEEGRKLLSMLGSESRLHNRRPDSRTTVKIRGFCGNVQMFRADRNYTLSEEEQSELPTMVARELKKEKFDAVVLSDYGRGVLGHSQEIMKLCANIPIYVDPKGDDWSRYAGATIIKANESELTRELAFQNCASDELIARLKLGFIVETRGSRGVALHGLAERPLFFECPRIVSGDPTGAGDTFLAQLVFSHVVGYSLTVSIQRAQYTASIAVEHVGTHAVSDVALNELLILKDRK